MVVFMKRLEGARRIMERLSPHPCKRVLNARADCGCMDSIRNEPRSCADVRTLRHTR